MGRKAAFLIITILIFASIGTLEYMLTNTPCSTFCPLNPHVQCVGRWESSGTYPGCICRYVCGEGAAD